MARQRLSDPIVADILCRIGSGELIEGSPLPPEAALSASYGVGRSVMREALRGLAAKGFLAARQGAPTVIAARQRWQVLDPDFLAVTTGEDFFESLQEARGALEPKLAALAALRATPAALAELDALARRQAESEQTPEQHADLDIAFHEAIAAATMNPVLMSLHQSVTGLGRRTRIASASRPGAVERAAFWHRNLVRAIASGDPEAASAAMVMHLMQTNEELRGLTDDHTDDVPAMPAMAVTRKRGLA